MLDGACHCGQVRWTFDGVPESATICNCTICRRHGVLWAYDFEGERIALTGATTAYVWGERTVSFHFCPTCGCLAAWRAQATEDDGRRRIAVNLRLAEPAAVAAIVLDPFDGLDTFTDLPRDGRCIADVWA